ncbi:shikimate kinase [Crateriforma spongiae]|uniref:shikimate kinase n=1 Tax=Crateriforma spongiae TaxID=2724528 RepID=UPI0039B0A575
MNVVLVGYRGTGKSAVANRIARRLNLRKISLDDAVVRTAGKSIPEIVDAEGWTAFRDLEESVVQRFTGQDGLVIDCGGGVIERDANLVRLKQAGPVIWLTASVPTIARRIGGDTQRPSLTGSHSFVDEIADVLQRRHPRYQSVSDFEVCTDDVTVAQVADAVVAWLVEAGHVQAS